MIISTEGEIISRYHLYLPEPLSRGLIGHYHALPCDVGSRRGFSKSVYRAARKVYSALIPVCLAAPGSSLHSFLNAYLSFVFAFLFDNYSICFSIVK